MAVQLFKSTGGALTLLTATLSARHLLKSWKDAPQRYEDLCMLHDDLYEYRESKWDLLEIMERRRHLLRFHNEGFARLREKFERQSKELGRAIRDLDRFLRKCDTHPSNGASNANPIDKFLEESIDTVMTLFSPSSIPSANVSRWKVGISQSKTLQALEKRLDQRIDRFDSAWNDLCRYYELTVERPSHQAFEIPSRSQNYYQEAPSPRTRPRPLSPSRQQLAIEW